MRDVEWRRTSTLMRGNPRDELEALKGRPPKNVGGTLVRSLPGEGPPHELDLLLFPIVVGTGKKPFCDSARELPLNVVAPQQLDTGVVRLASARTEP